MSTSRRRRPTISPDWVRRPYGLVRQLRFRDFPCALRFASLIGGVDDFGRHPDICVSGETGGTLRLTLSSPRHSGITEQELRLAARLDAVIAEHYDFEFGAPRMSLAAERPSSQVPDGERQDASEVERESSLLAA
ncbi:MAG TPA: 4a-hydroxytetrahydrobiopterin dehydratase [Solirubrobacteraceae bacterium]|nr:4a-hydroxytetrahydrobiopterin dehydratase [Solirubrobacteraceae bacterium]